MQFNWIDLGLLLISAGALVISLINTRHNIKFKKNQDKLNEIKLQKEEKADQPEIIIELIPNKDNQYPEYYAVITNTGGSEALNIELTYEKKDQWYVDTRNLPYEILKPGQNIKLYASMPRAHSGKMLCNLKWFDKSGREFEESAVLSK